MNKVEKEWKNQWEPIIMKNGEVDIEQLKKELYDFSVLIENATKVYCEVSGNRLSYPSYPAKTVISAYEENLADLREYWEEDFREDNDCTCGINPDHSKLG